MLVPRGLNKEKNTQRENGCSSRTKQKEKTRKDRMVVLRGLRKEKKKRKDRKTSWLFLEDYTRRKKGKDLKVVPRGLCNADLVDESTSGCGGAAAHESRAR